MIQFAIDEYRNSGRDVHIFVSGAVDPVNGSGPALDEIVTAINDRGVDKVALLGYSRGGGKVYELAEALDGNPAITRPFTIPMTAYVDAINALLALDPYASYPKPLPEIKRPPLSLYHLNQYQLNSPYTGARGILSLANDE